MSANSELWFAPGQPDVYSDIVRMGNLEGPSLSPLGLCSHVCTWLPLHSLNCGRVEEDHPSQEKRQNIQIAYRPIKLAHYITDHEWCLSLRRKAVIILNYIRSAADYKK